MFTSNFTMLLLLFIWDFLVTLATIHEYELQPKSFAIKSNQLIELAHNYDQLSTNECTETVWPSVH